MLSLGEMLRPVALSWFVTNNILIIAFHALFINMVPWLVSVEIILSWNCSFRNMTRGTLFNVEKFFWKYWCLFYLLIQKLFLPRSNFFEPIQYFLNPVKFFDHGQRQDFTLWLKIFELIQRILKTVKNIWRWPKNI